jgi:hypothetical protein
MCIHQKKTALVSAIHVVILLFCLKLPGKIKSENTLVYYPTLISAAERQSALKSAGISATVFAQFREFHNQVKEKKPETIIATHSFGLFHPEYKPILQFASAGDIQDHYVVLALNEKWTPQNIKAARVGAIEETGRQGIGKVVQEQLDSSFRLLKSVARPEDLISLLVFKSVDVIVLSEENYGKLQSLFNVKMKVVKKTKGKGRPVLYVREDIDKKAIFGEFKSISPKILATLGFTSVRELSKTPEASSVSQVASLSKNGKVLSSSRRDSKQLVPRASVINKKILFVRKGGDGFTEVYLEMKKELENHINTDFVITDKTEYGEFVAKVKQVNPDLLILMDNLSVNFAIKYNAEDIANPKPGVALMALNLRQVLKGVSSIAGIVFETNPFSMLMEYRRIARKEVKNVLVFSRQSEFQSIVDVAREQLAQSSILLHVSEIAEQGKSRAELETEIKVQLKSFLSVAQKYDAVWVMLDSKLLSPNVFLTGWLPAAQQSNVAFVTGIEDFVKPSLEFAVFAVTPNLPNLASQAVQIIDEILSGSRAPSEIGIEEIVAVNKIINIKRAKELGITLSESDLVDVKIAE